MSEVLDLPTEGHAAGDARVAPPPDSVCLQAGFDRCVARLLDVLEAGILICSSHGVLQYINPTGCEILGISADSVRGVQVGRVLAPLAELEALSEAAAGRMSPELAVTGGDGRPLKIGFRLGSSLGLSAAELEPQVVILFQDITSFVEVREERDRLLSLDAVSRLLPTIAHEIKNPLAGIQCLAEALECSLEDDEQREDLRAILSEVERMRLIVDGLGLAGRRLSRDLVRTDVCRELASLDRLVGARAVSLGVTLEWACRLEDPAAVDPSTLRLVLINLINNALDACSSGGHIVVEVDAEDDLLRLQVRDTGCGMSEEAQRRATDLFYTTKPQGSGIGLALLTQLVQRDGGEMRIDSQPDKGTVVAIDVPMRERMPVGETR